MPPVSSSIVSLPSWRALAEVGDLLLDVGQATAGRRRAGSAPPGRAAADRDADVEVAVVDDVVAVDRGVDDRIFLQRMHRRLDEERHEAELHAVLLLEAVLVRLRSSITGCMLTSLNVVRIAAVDCDCTRRSAMRWRRRDIGTRCSGRPLRPPGSRPAARARGRGTGRRRRPLRRRCAAGCARLAAHTSPLVTRPPRPLPPIGGRYRRPARRPVLRAAGMATAAAAAAGRGGGCAAAAGAAALDCRRRGSASAAALASVSIAAITSLLATVPPSPS